MSVKSNSSIGDAFGAEIMRFGYLKKLKTMRKKFFVLRAETLESSARLEYYDSEKKYRSHQPPKRSISLKACFNINKRVDTKHRHVIALYTKDDCFCVVLDSEKELDEWLKALLSLQHGEDILDGEPPKPTFEHVWQVTMLNKGLGSTRNILGAYHLCFTDKTLSLVRKAAGPTLGPADHVEFSLMSIRRCGHSECFFYMEVGRSAVTGAGELWMQTEDTNIAQNMGEVILRAMSNNNKEDLAPKPRIRSSSANEASKPILVQRRQTHTGQKSTSYCSPSQDGVSNAKEVPVTVAEASGSTVAAGYSNISTPCPTAHTVTAMFGSGFVSVPPLLYQRPSQRRHSVSGGAAPWPGTAHHQRTQSLPLAQHVCPDNNNSNSMHLPPVRSAKRTCTGIVGGGTRLTARDRSDSMPTRPRTTSEGTPPPPPIAIVTPFRSYLTPHRPQSLYREISHSPPAGSPISPASVTCSTDSAGSSLSIDEPDAWTEYTEGVGRFGSSVTPDEPIVEETLGSLNSSPVFGGYVPMAPLSSDDGYVDMSPKTRQEMSPAPSTCSVTSGTPSTDLRFSEYHLEKVASYFTPSEDDDTSSERPLRAYSVGSRPKVDNCESSRVRAFSVGSRKGVHRVLPPHGHPPSTGTKSSSAPLLLTSNTNLGSHSSMERMDDLMEIDFSKPIQNTGYVDMSPKNRNGGYVEMKPGDGRSPQKAKHSHYVEMGKVGTSPKNSSKIVEDGYMDMDFKPNRTQPVDLPVPRKTAEGYMDMSWSRRKTNDDYINMSRKKNNKSKKSQPIAIQTSNNSFAAYLTRKNSPPKNLPLTTSPFSSLRRPRKNSKENEPIFPFSPGSPVKPFQNKSDYTEMNYVNYSPAPKQKANDFGEYAEMRPICKISKQISTLSMNKPCVFKPIVEPVENNRLGTTSPRPGDTAPLENNYETLKGGKLKNSRPESVSSEKSRPSSVSSEFGSNSSTIIGGSRPESVNAELITRPSSESSLHYASLDLGPNDLEEMQKSPRSMARSPTPTSTGSETNNFAYAEIDFVKSEGLKNAKVKL